MQSYVRVRLQKNKLKYYLLKILPPFYKIPAE